MPAGTPSHPRFLAGVLVFIAAALGVVAWVVLSPTMTWTTDGHGAQGRDGRPRNPSALEDVGDAATTELALASAQALLERSPGPERAIASTRRNLQIQVIDVRGAPLPHHEVALFDDYMHGGCSAGMEYWRGATDATGIATIERVDAILDLHAQRMQCVDSPVSFKLDIHGIDHGEIRLSTTALRKQQVGLIAPLTEALDVEVVDPAGMPVAGANVYVNAAAFAGRPMDKTIAAARTDAEGRARLERIQSGSRIQVGAWLDDRRWCRVVSPATTWGFQGPRPIVLKFERAPVRLRGQLVDPLGRPFTTKRLRVERETGGHRDAWGGDILSVGRGPVRYETDEEGRFDLAFSGSIAAGQHDLTVIDQGDLLAHGSLTFFVPNLMETGAIEVGTIVVEPAPVLFTGRVIDGTGRVVSNAKLAVELVGAESAYLYRTTGPDEQGAFSVRGICDRLNAEIEATCEGYLSSGPTTVDGRGPWILRLTRAGSIQISTRIELEDLSPNLDVFVDDVWTSYVYEDAPEVLEGLRPGTHHVALHASGEPVAEFDVPVRPGEVTVMPTIDLRGHLREVSILVQDTDGERIDNGWFQRTDIADPELEYFWKGRVHLLLPRGTANLEISSYGRGLITVVAGPAEQIVQLPPAIEIQVIPDAGDGDLTRPARTLSADAKGGPLVETWLHEQPEVEFGQGSYLFLVPCPGRYEIAATSDLPAIPFDVQVVAGRQVIELPRLRRE